MDSRRKSENIRLQIPLMPRQQPQRLLTAPITLQHRPTERLNARVIRKALRQLQRALQRRVMRPRRVLRQRLHRGEVGGVVAVAVGIDLGDRLVGRAQGNPGAQLEDTRRELVLGGQRGGVEVEDGVVLALVQGVVDVDEFWAVNGGS
jgi:hypothetical protein